MGGLYHTRDPGAALALVHIHPGHPLGMVAGGRPPTGDLQVAGDLPLTEDTADQDHQLAGRHAVYQGQDP